MTSPKRSYLLKEIASRFNLPLKGNPNCQISGVSSILDANKNDITFINSQFYKKDLQKTQAACVILEESIVKSCPTSTAMLISDNPRLTFAKIALLFQLTSSKFYGVHKTVVLGKHCSIHPKASIGPYCILGDHVTIDSHVSIQGHCFIGNYSKIGSYTHLSSHVNIYDQVTIGNHVVIDSGAVIGSDGFGMVKDNDKQWARIPHFGSVVIDDHVTIGANTTIDKASFKKSFTHIGLGSKLDNQIQIAHNVSLGKHSLIAACTTVGGSSKIGNYCTIGGCVAIADHIMIPDYTVLAGGSQVRSSVKQAGVYASGSLLEPLVNWRKNALRFKQLDKCIKSLLKKYR